MTRQRIYGADSVWGAWVRSLGAKDGPLPSISATRGTTINDWDMIVHQYKTPVDSQGSRDVHCLMYVECKTHMGSVAPSQAETLWFNHQATAKKINVKQLNKSGRVAVWHYGVSLLSCDKADPACSLVFRWGRFDDAGRIQYYNVDMATIVHLLRFDLDPDTLRPTSFRRHHKVQYITRRILTPLGFWIDETYRTAS